MQSRFERSRSVLLVLAFLAGAACDVEQDPSTPITPRGTLADFQKVGLRAVPGGEVDVVGGVFYHRRLEHSIQTRLGSFDIYASYSSIARRWWWSVMVYYDGEYLIDESGDVQHVLPVAAGAAIPGTVWIKVDSDTLMTQGGLVYEFGADSAPWVDSIHWIGHDYPRFDFTQITDPSNPRSSATRATRSASSAARSTAPSPC